MIDKCFRFRHQNILSKMKVLSKKSSHFATATGVGRGTIHHRTRVNIDNFTIVKNRDILLTRIHA